MFKNEQSIDEFKSLTDLETVLEVSNNLYCAVDLSRKKIFTNKKWSKFFGKKFDNCNVNFCDLIEESQVQKFESYLLSSQKNEKSTTKLNLTCLDEFKNKYKTNWRVKYNADKEIYTCEVDLSSTQKKHLNTDKKESQNTYFQSVDESFRAIVDHIPIMLSLFDARGNFEWVNKVWCEELGWDLNSMRNRDMLAEFYPDLEIRKEVLTFMLSKKPGWKDFYLRKKDGTYIHTSWANVHLSNGQAIGIGQNISDRHRLQTQLIQTSKKVSLGELASGVAHEINNPLTVIYGKANYLINQIQKQKIEGDQIVTELEKISVNSERIATIIRSLRSFSLDTELTPFTQVQIKSAFENALNICRQLFKNKNIELTINIDPAFRVSGRSSDLSQAFLNLMTNAYEAVLNVEDKWIKVDSEQNENYYYIRIIDSGLGISEKILGKIMDPFFTTKPVGSGVGLGLSIAANIFEKHGGSVVLEKSCNNTCFKICLPVLS
jgi:PAS domain S-box-containing protein